MGDVVRNGAMSCSGYIGLARKDNAEEVAKRRAAIQQEIEQRFFFHKICRELLSQKKIFFECVKWPFFYYV